MQNKLALLDIKNLGIGYDKKIIADNISWTIYRGNRFVITGHNGSGKTTLVKTIIGLLSKLSGEMSFFDAKGNKQDKVKIGYLPQVNLIDRKFPIKICDIIDSALIDTPKTEVKSKILKLLEMVGLSKYANESISILSGGQLQRLLLARALANEPELLVLDEPLSYLDNNYKSIFYKIIDENVSKDTAILMITHEKPKEFDSWESIDFSYFFECN